MRRSPERFVGFDAERFLEQALLGEAVMGVPVAASVFDLDRYYVAVNEAFCDLTQYGRSELTAIKAGTALAPDDDAREAVHAAIRKRGAVGETNLRRKDGSVIPIAYWVMETRLALGVYFFRLTWRPGTGHAPLLAL
jgi:PAS domain S-box-containing protein